MPFLKEIFAMNELRFFHSYIITVNFLSVYMQ
nr:MAG TPA: hypothetical protein [Caudoviricetes sp.]DAY44981.1 MAG TPA: hypothetical protein [Caudoviricetes sp.]DAZ79630.1 MAG TPA: hypothetical protein [Caudoviricetes sp.]